MLELKKIKPLYTGIITTAEKYGENTTIKGSSLIDSSKVNTLKEYQTVLSKGDMVRNVNVGDLILINPAAYEVKKFGNSVREDMVDTHKLEKSYNFNIVVIDGKQNLLIQERDVEFVIEEWEEVEDAPTTTIMTENDTKGPLIIT